jgi:hypothetical protein
VQGLSEGVVWPRLGPLASLNVGYLTPLISQRLSLSLQLGHGYGWVRVDMTCRKIGAVWLPAVSDAQPFATQLKKRLMIMHLFLLSDFSAHLQCCSCQVKLHAKSKISLNHLLAFSSHLQVPLSSSRTLIRSTSPFYS